MSLIEIRPLSISDAAATLDLLRPIIDAGTTSIMTSLPDLSGQIAWIQRVVERGVGYVAVASGEVVGIQSIEPVSSEPALHGVGDISTFVDSRWTGQGIGKRLAETSLAAAAQRFRKVMAVVRADNPTALAYYRSLGFAKVGIARNHAEIRGRLIDEVILERFLQA